MMISLLGHQSRAGTLPANVSPVCPALAQHPCLPSNAGGFLQTNFPDLDEQRMEQVYHMTGGNARELRRTLPVLAVATPQEEEEEEEGGGGRAELPETSPARWPLPMEQALPRYTRRLRSKGVGSAL